jgi:hypothetical protein
MRNVDQRRKEAKTINKVIEQVTSNSTTFRQFFRLFPNGETGKPFVSSSTSGAVT